jgi:hypothetical protein
MNSSFSSFEYTSSGSTCCFEPRTPRPGADTLVLSTPRTRFSPSFGEESPTKIRRTTVSPKSIDNTVYRFDTNPKLGDALKKLDASVKSGGDIALDDFTLLQSALRQNSIRICVGHRRTITEHRNLIEAISKEMIELQKSISFSTDPDEIERLRKNQREKQTFLRELREVNPREKVVPHHTKIHPAYFNKFRDVLNPTSNRLYPSTNALMKQVSNDIDEFLTSPLKLENRRRVIQQIRDSRH